MDFATLVEHIGEGVDEAGVFVVGAVLATVFFLLRVVGRAAPFISMYTRFRQGLGRAILLGLELLVAGDIIRTVAVSPSFTSVGVLAIIVLIRTFLSLELELEIEGRWPWQRHVIPAEPQAPSNLPVRDGADSPIR